MNEQADVVTSATDSKEEATSELRQIAFHLAEVSGDWERTLSALVAKRKQIEGQAKAELGISSTLTGGHVGVRGNEVVVYLQPPEIDRLLRMLRGTYKDALQDHEKGSFVRRLEDAKRRMQGGR